MRATDEFWAGEFGDEYNKRNSGPEMQPARIAMFSKIMARTPGVESILEVGCNTGENLRALRALGYTDLRGVEINAKAAKVAGEIADVEQGSFLEMYQLKRDLVLSAGVLIHIHPDDLDTAYERIYKSALRYILLIEYYNPTPLEILYRGNEGQLWKRDFAGEMLTRYPMMRLVDYGFIYHLDTFPQDDVTWFLMEVNGRTG